jgi:osmotically-inducible protein OsmY
MADRDRYDWDRGRDFDRDRDYGRGSERGYQDRGVVSRGTDEVRSWFGDDEARRRREMDEQRERGRDRSERDYGANSERARSEHGWDNRGQRPDTQWEGGRSHYGDQRDFVGRSNDWSGSTPYDEGSHWSGGSHDYGDEDARRRHGNWQYTGGFAAGRPSSSFSGGYGAGNYESGNYRGGSGYGGGYRPSESGTSGREFGATTGEGRWSGQQQFNQNPSYPDAYRGSSYGSSFTGGRPSGESYRGGMFSGRGPRNYQRSDERIREDVNERLTIDPRIDASEIDVRVQNGEVTLSGTVDDRRTRRLAEEIIEDLPGVRDVRNDLRVQPGHWDEGHRHVGEQSRKHEDGSIGNTGDPQRRDDITTVNVKEGGKK